jgi:hypothetical protein
VTCTFKPDDPVAGDLDMPNGFWTWLLEEGVGLAFRVAQGPGVLCSDVLLGSALDTWVYEDDGLNPTTHDGFHVCAADALVVAHLLRNLAWAEGEREQALARRSREDRKWLQDHRDLRLVHLPGPPQYREMALRFAEWAARSGGFRVC